jgi:sugar lactone lactonase YvrE
VADNLKMANGITIVGEKLYVADTLEKAIVVYDRIADGKLSKNQTVKLGHVPDNVKYDSNKKRVHVAGPATSWDLTHFYRSF